MPISYTPTAQFTQLGTTGAIIMPDAPVGVTSPVQNLADAALASRACLYSYLDWDQRIWTQGTLANTGNTGIWVGGINAIALSDGASPPVINVYNLRVPTQVNVGATVLIGGSWYYIYAYISGGAVAIEVTTTPPEQNYFHWKNGAAFTHRYLGAFVTASTGVPLPFYQLRGEHRYAFDEITATGANSLTPWGTITGPGTTNQSLTARIPPFSRPVRTLLRLEGVNTDAVLVQQFSIASTTAAFGGTVVNPRLYALAPGQYAQDEITIDPSAAGSVDVACSTADVTVTMYCLGWIDPGCP